MNAPHRQWRRLTEGELAAARRVCLGCGDPPTWVGTDDNDALRAVHACDDCYANANRSACAALETTRCWVDGCNCGTPDGPAGLTKCGHPGCAKCNPFAPTTDETLTAKVTEAQKQQAARVIKVDERDLAEHIAIAAQEYAMCEAANARIAELEQQLREACEYSELWVKRIAVLEQQLRDAPVTAAARTILEEKVQARVAELEQDVRTFVAAESATRDIVKATARAMRRRAAMRPLPQRPWPVARQVDDWAGKLEDAVAPPLWGLYSDATEAFIREWRLNRTPRAPRVTRSGKRAASARVQPCRACGTPLDYWSTPAPWIAENLCPACGVGAPGNEARARLARQAASGENAAGSSEHGTERPTAGPVPAARQTARAAGKQAAKASFEAECRRREASRQRGPPSAPPAPRDVAHVAQKKTKKKKQRATRAVRQIRSRKRGSP